MVDSVAWEPHFGVDVERPGWVKCERAESWGDAFYTLPGERLNASGTVERDNALLLAPGHLMQIRFPDGCEATLPLMARKESGSYSDHGNRCEFVRTLLGFELPICGLKPWVELTEVELRRDALIYSKPRKVAGDG